jgi:hypothetical protein
LEMLEERQFWAEIEQVEIALHAFLKKLWTTFFGQKLFLQSTSRKT